MENQGQVAEGLWRLAFTPEESIVSFSGEEVRGYLGRSVALVVKIGISFLEVLRALFYFIFCSSLSHPYTFCKLPKRL